MPFACVVVPPGFQRLDSDGLPNLSYFLPFPPSPRISALQMEDEVTATESKFLQEKRRANAAEAGIDTLKRKLADFTKEAQMLAKQRDAAIEDGEVGATEIEKEKQRLIREKSELAQQVKDEMSKSKQFQEVVR